VRSCDTIGRYGGDEFVAILPETKSGRGVPRVAERLRSVLASKQISSVEGRLTASVGVRAVDRRHGKRSAAEGRGSSAAVGESRLRTGVVSLPAPTAISA